MNRKRSRNAKPLRAVRGRGRPQLRNNSRLAPPAFSSNVRLNHRFRFIASTAFSAAVLDTEILGALGTICYVTNSMTANIIRSFKIRRIEVWSTPATQGGMSTCSVEWFGFGNSPNVEISDTTNNVSRNACISTSPPVNSLASFWQVSTGMALFTLVCPINSIIDIIVDMVIGDDETLVANVVATGILGHIYFLPLDGTTTHLLTPVSLVSTF